MKSRLLNSAAIFILLFVQISNRIQAQSSSATNPALEPCRPTAMAATTEASTANATENAAPATQEAANGAPILNVVTTVAPLTNLAYNIGGGRVKVFGLIPEGADSHTFEPKPSAAVALSAADIVIVNGLHLEEPTQKLAESNLKQGAEIVELGAQTLTESDYAYDFSFPKENGTPNPHLWMNPLLALNYAKIMRDVFTKRDPDGQAYYAANFAEMEQRLTVLDQAICDAVSTIPEKNRKLLTYHDSFAYFAPRYNMQVIGAIQPADFAEPSAQEVAKLIDQIKSQGVPAIFGSEVFPSKVIDQIGKEAGVQFVQTLADDDLPNQTENRLYHSYLQLLVNDVQTIAQSLGGNASALKVVNTANLHGPDTAVETVKE